MGEWRGTEAELSEMLMRFQSNKGRYCSYISGMCATNNVQSCAKRNPQECRTCRQKNERAAISAKEN